MSKCSLCNQDISFSERLFGKIEAREMHTKMHLSVMQAEYGGRLKRMIQQAQIDGQRKKAQAYQEALDLLVELCVEPEYKD